MASVRKKKSQIEKFGAAKAPWVVYWRDVNGNQKSKSFPAGERGKREAKAFADKADAEQKLGIQNTESDVSWARFRREYEEFKQPKVRGITLGNTRTALDHFERLIGPRKVSRISQRDIDRFTSLRQKEQGQYGPVAVVSVVTTLKCIQTALRQAKRWKYLDEVPEFQMPRVEQRQPSYIGQDEFAAMYEAAAEMTSPQIPGVTPADYWRALITFLYLTGWRIGSSVALRWDQLEETDQGVVVSSPAEQNKGKRDVQITLHPEVARHLTPLREANSLGGVLGFLEGVITLGERIVVGPRQKPTPFPGGSPPPPDGEPSSEISEPVQSASQLSGSTQAAGRRSEGECRLVERHGSGCTLGCRRRSAQPGHRLKRF